LVINIQSIHAERSEKYRVLDSHPPERKFYRVQIFV